MDIHTLVGFEDELTKIAQAGPGDIAAVVPGLLAGYYTGKAMAGHTAAGMAPHGYKTRSEDIARRVAMVAAPVAGVAALALAHKHGLTEKAVRAVHQHFPTGMVMDPHQESDAVRAIAPALLALGGGTAGGILTGGAVGGIARLKNRAAHREKTSAVNWKYAPAVGTVAGGVLGGAAGATAPGKRGEKKSAKAKRIAIGTAIGAVGGAAAGFGVRKGADAVHRATQKHMPIYYRGKRVLDSVKGGADNVVEVRPSYTPKTENKSGGKVIKVDFKKGEKIKESSVLQSILSGSW